MRVLLTGATGLIGSAVLAALRRDGHEVVAVARAARRTRPADVRWVTLDIARATDPADWLPHLAGVDAVIDCAGVLQDGPGDSTAGVHLEGPTALFAACERAGVRRFVRVSAIGVDRHDAATPFARSKLEGDQALMARDLDWVILRPSVVVGRAAYGGSALFRGLAALPVLPLVQDAGPLQIVQLDDVVRTVFFFLRPAAPTKVALELAGPERLALPDVVRIYRRWLGWADAPSVAIPRWVSRRAFGAGDLVGLLGWRTPLRSTLAAETARGAVGDPAEWRRITGIEPQSLAAALGAEPASVQERWFAGLYFLKPLLLASLALFWIVTGLIAAGPGWRNGVGLLLHAGLGQPSLLLASAAAIADMLIGIGIAVRSTARWALLAACALSLAYLLLGTLLLPELWIDPLGPLLKIPPILVLQLVALATLTDR